MAAAFLVSSTSASQDESMGKTMVRWICWNLESRRSLEAARVATPFSESPEFQKLLAGGGHPSLDRIALEIARDAYPELDLELYLTKIEQLAERVRTRIEP